MQSITLTHSAGNILYGFPDYASMRKFRDALPRFRWAGELRKVTEMRAKVWVSRFAQSTHSGGYQNYRYWQTDTPGKEPVWTALNSLKTAVELLPQPVVWIVVV